jgi:hypothetical protein
MGGWGEGGRVGRIADGGRGVTHLPFSQGERTKGYLVQ